MRLYEENLERVSRWIDAIDTERDKLARSIDGTELQTEVHIAFVKARLGLLETERADVVQLLGELEARRYHPALMFPVRPMLKMPLLRRQKRKRA